MERYELIKKVGHGAFGTVWRAKNKQTGEVVAIKELKKRYYSWDECISLREVKSLQKMNHPNIVELKHLILSENNILYFVFDYMEFNLYQLMKDKVMPFPESQVRDWCLEVFKGLAHMHQRGYFHRDLKPENLLLNKDFKIKIADLGFAREIDSQPPHTEYVSTRWYRAPELLFPGLYSSKVDMWAMGAIMAELLTLRPLFPGISQADEMYKICSVLGTPTEDSWADGLRLARDMNYQFPQLARVHLSSLIPSVSDHAISLISSLCSWDPSKRPTAAEAPHHPFFQSCYYQYYVPPPLRCHKSTTAGATRGASEQQKYLPPGKRVDHIPTLVNKGRNVARGTMGKPLHPRPMKAGVQWIGKSRESSQSTVTLSTTKSISSF
ncbi:putative protein-serine/threonine kinase CMGC-RCK family [Rosa chinensis]|uniref:cyclin-dependent kinase n=1 Tax=Rosa chinensis TaxID=74649 RepID=A0A2P6SMD7_ROSCH|nr:cyclin-dependent kinase F-4 [Rosa chinensis]PRQ59847.1 putative protein-serine/threonine kinase CMGC-RCK family [Rosa chinensis]